MKFLTSTLILTALSIGAVAESPQVIDPMVKPNKATQKLDKKKTKIVKKITTRLANLKQRKVCMANASSLKEMQSCRIEKFKNRPFKLKKGMTFEKKKEKKLSRMSSRILMLEKKISCVQDASNITVLKACRKQKVKPLVPQAR